jgi:hypothetical protein
LTESGVFGWKITTSSCWPIALSNWLQPDTATAVAAASAKITGTR